MENKKLDDDLDLSKLENIKFNKQELIDNDKKLDINENNFDFDNEVIYDNNKQVF